MTTISLSRVRFAALALLLIVGGQPAQAMQFGDMLKGAMSQMPAARATAAPARAPAKPAAETTGAMGLQASTALPPLRRLGTDAVAVVDAVSGTTAVRPMDYVFANQTIALGPKGRLTLSYLSGCLSEVIQGGAVTVSQTGSRAAGGKVQPRTTPGCRAARPIILASASEAGATVNRITPFSAGNWNERALKSVEPVFKWDMALGAVVIRVKNMDAPGEPVVWQGPATGDWIAYPKTAPRLVAGAPFKVEALAGEKVVASALFSIDPGLDQADTLANRIVPLPKS
jgi:hypothetical protein